MLHSEALKNHIRDTQCTDVSLLAVSTRVDISSCGVFARQFAHTFRDSNLDIGGPNWMPMVRRHIRMPQLSHRELETLGLESGVGSPPWKVK